MNYLESKWGDEVKDYVEFVEDGIRWHWKDLDREDIPSREKDLLKDLFLSKNILFGGRKDALI